ncbi:hypothetical protein MBLNU230_g1250t1 [Neophaeotheca triangularis]
MPGRTFEHAPWWKSGVVYQIYPASYNDSNNDGIGDLEGIIQKLDYIQSLGVDIIWTCPHYDSPQIDMGYDISDYQSVYPPYGTLEDCERLISETHDRGMKIIFDLVINHTSDQHKWFKESRSSTQNAKRDWYIWRPAKYDEDGNRHPPNNWRSNFTGPAWTWDEQTQEYYLNLFAPEQPDLNWENEETRAAIYEEAMEFWLRRGVDGFRVDTVNMYSKGDLIDAPVTQPGEATQFAGMQYCNGPRMFEFLAEMNAVLSKYDAMTVGECPNTPDMARVQKYVSASEKALNMVFQFDIVDVGIGQFKFQTTPFNWTLPEFKSAVSRTQSIMSGTDSWSTSFLENHDQARAVSRFGNDSHEFREISAKMLALMLVTLSGTLYLYQGQEIGMINMPLSWSMDEYKDLDSSNYYNMVKRNTNGDPAALQGAKEALQYLARDHARVPMQWDSSENGGFSKAKPWMRANDSYREINAAAQEGDPSSVLAFWKLLLQIRKKYLDTFVFGDFQCLDSENQNTFTYSKKYQDQKVIVVLNFTSQRQANGLSSEYSSAELLIGTLKGGSRQTLAPYEGRVYAIA